MQRIAFIVEEQKQESRSSPCFNSVRDIHVKQINIFVALCMTANEQKSTRKFDLQNANRFFRTTDA